MTTEEFSNNFDTLLSSYLHLVLFGELSSYADVTLDEYEKSIFLTLAQDLLVKTYFERLLNSNGEGFDDSARRLMDYAKLITTATFINVKTNSSEAFSDKGVILNFNTEDTTVPSYEGPSNPFGKDSVTGTYYKTPLFIINERVVAGGKNSIVYTSLNLSEIESLVVGDTYYLLDDTEYIETTLTSDLVTKIQLETIKAYKKELQLTGARSYVIVPINYKEYDRMMSKAYCEPLKRLAWRLFETDSSYLTQSVEIILRSDAGPFRKYVIRYVRRPRPIVLVDLSGTDNGLSIDGVTARTECELNPILHLEILQLAVLLALASRGIETRDAKAAREQAQKSNN